MDCTVEQIVAAIRENRYFRLLLEEDDAELLRNESLFIRRINGPRGDAWLSDIAGAVKSHIADCDDAWARGAVTEAYNRNASNVRDVYGLWMTYEKSDECMERAPNSTFLYSTKAVDFRTQIFKDRDATHALTRKAFLRKLTEFKHETATANETGHPGYDGCETARRVYQVYRLVLEARNMQIDYDEEELLELLNDIIAADNSRRQATSHLDIENFRDSGFFAFYNAIVKALQARGYVPEKVLSRARGKGSGNGRQDVTKEGGNGRQTRRSVNAVQATADSSDSDGDSDDDSGADVGGDYGISSAGTQPLVGNVLEVHGDDGTLMDNGGHTGLDSGG